jgi:prepilin-type N-terminal cleavage/methylation domain-containing protein
MSIASRASRPGPEGGFSLIEVLVATLIFAFILLGLVPLFTRAMADNASGRDAGSQANLGRSHLEELIQLPFDHDALELTAGTTAVETRYLASGTSAMGDETWQATVPSGPREVAPWQRVTTVRQFAIHGVQDTDGDGVIDVILGLEDADGDGIPDAALDADTLPGGVHVKGLDIRVDSRREDDGPVVPTPPVRLQAVKAF